MNNDLYIIENDAPKGNGVPKEFKVLPLGLVHSLKGDFLVDNESYACIRNDFKTRKLQIPVDYEHQTLQDVQAPAAGWIQELSLKRDGIYATVDWTDKAAEYLSKKEYKYCSPVIMVRPADHKALKLHSVALTNKPAIDAMTPIVNSDKPSGAADQPEGEVIPSNSFKALATLLGLSEAATLDDIYQAVSSLLNDAASTKLKADAFEFESFKNQVELEVEKAMKEGKVTPAQKDWAFRSAMNDLDDFALWCKTAVPVVPLGSLNISTALSRRAVSQSDELMGLTHEDVQKFGKL